MTAKAFHIGDILSVMLEAMFVVKDEMTMPDGTVRPALPTNMHGLAAIIEHVSGNPLFNPDNPMQINTPLMWHLLPHVKRSLEMQFPELRKVEFPGDDMPQDQEKAMAYIKNWLCDVAARHGGEWREVREDMDIGRVHHVSLGGLNL